jgi:hypothetical protein
MNWDMVLSGVASAASLVGLFVKEENQRKRAIWLLVAISFLLLGQNVLTEMRMKRLQQRIVTCLDESRMSSDQLFECVYTAEISRSLFDKALNEAVESGQLGHQSVELRTAENRFIRVRIFFAR